MNTQARIFVAGHRGLVGSALCRLLQQQGYGNVLTASKSELDLCRAAEVDTWFAANRPEYVFLAAAKVGGIHANNEFPVDFLRDNLAIELNVFAAAHRHAVEKLLFLGSSCVYPKLAPQPIHEDALLGGHLEPTNQWYAIAKIAGILMAQAYRKQYGFRAISLMPTNLYGPGDNFDLNTSHVLPALLRKFHQARLNNDPHVTVWGSGSPLREFLHVDDLAEAALLLMREYDEPGIINVGTGRDISIAGLASLIASITGFEGSIVFDASKPDGTPRKVLDTSRINSLGWNPKRSLRQGIEDTYRWYVASQQTQAKEVPVLAGT
jgi:GDP-L-fucose synthase